MEADASRVKKPRKVRSDAYWDSKRRVGNYAGRKKSEKWTLLKKAYDIISWKHIPKWKKEFGIGEGKWFRFFLLFVKAKDEGVDVTEFPEFNKIGTRGLDKLKSEFSIFVKVDTLFNEEVEKAIARNNENDKMFLNRIREVWGDEAPAILKDFKEKKRGRKSSSKVYDERCQRVKKYSQKNSGTAPAGFHTRDYPIALCRLAYLVHGRLFMNRSRTISFGIKDLEEEAHARTQAILKAQRNIDKAQKLIDKFKISRSELEREIIFKKTFSLFDIIPSIVVPA